VSAVTLLRGLAGNNVWSTDRLYRACAKLSTAEWNAQRTSFFPSLPTTLNHVLIVDWYYLDALERGGKGRSVFANEVPFADCGALHAAQRDADMRLLAFTNALTDDALASEVRLERANHIQVDTVSATLMHLFVHQIHHRGQAHAMLAGTPVKPPQLDEFFMGEDLPLRQAELVELGLPIR
jgi:uncharacterized damage-inducible protein DinB